MTPRQVITMIVSTCEDLHSIGLVAFYNSPCETRCGLQTLVSYPALPTIAAQTYPFGSLEQYLGWVKQGEFTCLLFDYSLVRASYECAGNAILGHTLLYWPCPIEFREEVEDLADVCAGLELCLESPAKAADACTLNLRTPMRFDFDPARAGRDHPMVHLHAQFEDARIHVHRPMCFTTFIKTIFRTFYRHKWVQHTAIGRLHEQPIQQGPVEHEPDSHCFQLSWA